MDKNIKIFRIGHRLPRKLGVITIASKVFPDTKEVYYGTSYCHPKEKSYDKQWGITQALHNLSISLAEDESLKLNNDITHTKVLNIILNDMFFDEDRPKWATGIISEQLRYPSGLKRFPSELKKFPDNADGLIEKFGISSIVVNSEFAKKQLIMALKYIDNSCVLDDEFVSIGLLLDMAYEPDLIVVQQ